MERFKQFAKTPPMGWNSWDCFGAGVTEQQLRENADYMARYLKPYGWQYIVCDIQWYEPCAKDNIYNDFYPLTMDEYGRLLPAENRFPSAAGGRGFGPIADYIHSLGLKFGIHIMRGVPRQAVARNCPIQGSTATCREIAHPFSICSWNTDMYGLKDCPGAQDYYNSLLRLYASWGVDFIKCDDICVTEFRKWDNPYSAAHEIEMLRRAIDGCGREIVLSLSPGPALREQADHLCRNANMWRMTGDFWDSWDKLHEMFRRCELWQGVPSEGNWPDCDMLPIGRLAKNAPYSGPQDRMTQFTREEQYTLMTLWGIFRSPLMMGGNLPDNDPFTLSLLTNPDYLEMHRHSQGARLLENREVKGKGSILWTANGRHCKYLAVFNTDDRPRRIGVDLRRFLMPDTMYQLQELWTGQQTRVKNSFQAQVAPHGAKLYRIQ